MSTIEELRALLAAATPGPWEHRQHEGMHALAARDGWAMESEPDDSDDGARVAADFALVAAMRNALPALLDVAEAARAVARSAGPGRACWTVGRHDIERLRAALARLDGER